KSGKSYSAEQYTKALQQRAKKPYYLATTEFIDDEIQERITIHKQRRDEHFITIEEPLDIYNAIKKCDGPVLVECTTMWINNMLYHQQNKEQILEHITKVLTLPNDIIFVHNDVGAGIIPDNALARQYIDISGIVSQIIASHCDEVFHCIAGIATQIKGRS
ncbi:MAG: bifunctional adenosylcobinamide kinase/adenosylcobinamide-phosphate guanylyltransferase, partial [Sulfurimonadaceae bacterium]